MEIPFEDDGDEVNAEQVLLADDDYSLAVTSPLLLHVSADMGGLRLDVILAKLLPEHSRSRLQGWIRAGGVQIDGCVFAEPKFKLNGGEVLAVTVQAAPEQTAYAPEAIPLNVVYADESIVVLDKPAGLVVHPGSGNWSGTLLNALLHYYPETAALPRAGIVHRLDKDTSGLMVVARSLTAQTDLVRQLQARTVKRQYFALAIGTASLSQGTVDAPMGRHPRDRIKMAIVDGGKPARTHYRVIERLADVSAIQCELDTGRTHQIRVHMASIKLPLVGDPLYRGHAHYKGPPFARQALHAQRLGLIHPETGLAMEWHSALPADLQNLLDALRHVSA